MDPVKAASLQCFHKQLQGFLMLSMTGRNDKRLSSALLSRNDAICRCLTTMTRGYGTRNCKRHKNRGTKPPEDMECARAGAARGVFVVTLNG